MYFQCKITRLFLTRTESNKSVIIYGNHVCYYPIYLINCNFSHRIQIPKVKPTKALWAQSHFLHLRNTFLDFFVCHVQIPHKRMVDTLKTNSKFVTEFVVQRRCNSQMLSMKTKKKSFAKPVDYTISNVWQSRRVCINLNKYDTNNVTQNTNNVEQNTAKYYKIETTDNFKTINFLSRIFRSKNVNRNIDALIKKHSKTNIHMM